jgi:hypothetical protein
VIPSHVRSCPQATHLALIFCGASGWVLEYSGCAGDPNSTPELVVSYLLDTGTACDVSHLCTKGVRPQRCRGRHPIAIHVLDLYALGGRYKAELKQEIQGVSEKSSQTDTWDPLATMSSVSTCNAIARKSELITLHKMKEQGALNEEEFQAAKEQLIGTPRAAFRMPRGGPCLIGMSFVVVLIQLWLRSASIGFVGNAARSAQLQAEFDDTQLAMDALQAVTYQMVAAHAAKLEETMSWSEPEPDGLVTSEQQLQPVHELSQRAAPSLARGQSSTHTELTKAQIPAIPIVQTQTSAIPNAKSKVSASPNAKPEIPAMIPNAKPEISYILTDSRAHRTRPLNPPALCAKFGWKLAAKHSKRPRIFYGMIASATSDLFQVATIYTTDHTYPVATL